MDYTVFLIFAGWLLLLFLSMPLGHSLIVVSLSTMLLRGYGLTFAVQKAVAGINSFTLLAVPFFLLTGHLMNTSGITRRIFDFAMKLVGHFRGGMGHVNILASLFFSGMSGSAMADSGGLGKLEIEAMREEGYDDDFSGAVTAASSIIGPLVPPSITMVLYGVISGASIGRLFLAGFAPGLLCTMALMVMVRYYAVKRNYPRRPKAGLKEIASSYYKSFFPLMTPVIIIFGIFSGIFSPTEAAVVAAAYSLILGVFLYREMGWKKVFQAFRETACTSASIGIIIIGVSLFGYVITREKIPQQVASWFLGVTDNPYIFLLMINLMFFILGAFIESLPLMLTLVPVLLPVVQSYDIDLVHFGIIITLNMMISILTPPMGVSLFIVSKVGNIPFITLARSILPWLIPILFVLLLLTLFPGIVLFLPNLVMPLKP